MFSRACEYGIRAMIHIAREGQDNKLVSLKEIATATNSPVAFTAKTLQVLNRSGLLISGKGASGGFMLSTAAEKINLAQIVKAIDGVEVFTGCGLGLEKCNALKPCPVHFKFATIRDSLAEMLYSTTLHELASGLKSGASFLVR